MKIGIITMHKVLNYGSALQSYALQYAVFSLNYECEIIDYSFNNRQRLKCSIWMQIFNFLKNALLGFPLEKKRKKFQSFYEENYRLSNIEYNSITIKEHPPQYDIYMVGSDQVWNPIHINGDDVFLLSFVDAAKPKVSFASSFATTVLPEKQIGMYKKYLNRFDFISVRETQGKEIITQLINRDAFVACDPTLLLPVDIWDKISDQSTLKLPSQYILVYELNYMFDPYPEIVHIINEVQKRLAIPVVFLDGRKEYAFFRNSRLIKSSGPSDFIKLIKNASFVITTSFHGTIFSTLYDKPLYGVVKNLEGGDSRIKSYLHIVGGENSVISYQGKNISNKEELLKLKADQSLIERYKGKSFLYLKEMLNTESKKLSTQ